MHPTTRRPAAALAAALLGLAAAPLAAAPGDRVSWQTMDLNRVGSRLSRRDITRMGSTLRSRGPEHPHVGFRWNLGDQFTRDWYPQGVCGLPGKWLLVSWYHKGEGADAKGARLSFVDVSDLDHVRYRHVLLVEPTGDAAGFRAVESHAGGLARVGSRIYVMNSSDGIRVFDLGDLFEAAPDRSEAKIGVVGGTAYALNYGYTLHQQAFLRQGDLGGPRYSWASVDWSPVPGARGITVVTGNYHKATEPYDNPPAAMAWWQIRPDGGLEKVRDSRDDATVRLRESAQGGASRDGVVRLVTSGSEARLWVARYPPRTEDDYASYPWAHGTEDLHLSASSGNLWCLTEHPGRRMVFAVKAADYPPPAAAPVAASPANFLSTGAAAAAASAVLAGDEARVYGVPGR